MLKVLIIEDHKILIEGIKELLSKEQSCAITYEAYNGTQGLELVQLKKDIDVVLLDINLPDMLGIEVCQKIKIIRADLPVLTLTMHESSSYLRKMINAGANGYILKDTSKEELLEAIHTIVEGNIFLSPKVKKIMIEDDRIMEEKKEMKSFTRLTTREKEVLKYILKEYTTDEMADEMEVSKHTIISHRKNLLKKLGAKNTAGIVKRAFESNLVE